MQSYAATRQNPELPSLPQHDSEAVREARAFQLSLARTSYNYMQSYLEGVPLSADLPKGEEFSIGYEAKVVQVFIPLAENFKRVVVKLLERELEQDLPTAALEQVRDSYAKLVNEFSLLHPLRDQQDLDAFFKALAALPEAMKNVINIPKDVAKMATGLAQVFDEFIKNGPTAFLKSTLFDMLSTEQGRNYLLPQSLDDYEMLFDSLPKPLMLTLAQQPWMPANGEKPCEQDWFFGKLQTGGFNTTNLRGIVLERSDQPGEQTVVLAELQQKFPINDAILQSVSGDRDITLSKAARLHRLYVCDYALMDGAKANQLHGQQRYLAAPIVLFYWNPTPPAGFPPAEKGVLQPIAIQLAQRHDAETAPIFTPNDCAQANDANGLKWRVAKYFVNVVCAIQHEAIAHLGDCHLIIEPIAVAAHRQLSTQHPILKLLIPHFRFTININDSAIHSLIIPGGVVATNVGPAIESTLELLAQAHQAWRWDANSPERVFKLRGVDQLPDFPYRDDAMLLWPAIKDFVAGYLRCYYANDAAVREDSELQGWIREMVAPRYAGFKGMEGLAITGDERQPLCIDSLDYLIDIVAQIIFIAGPQHASVNYAQYPLMSYMPSVAGTIYAPPPERSTELHSPADCMRWYPPLDVSLYTFSFEYLLSGVQYDSFGYYEDNPRTPYFTDPRVQPLVADFQDRLALAEIEIRKRNRSRALPYPFLQPTQIPNSISI
ncbi:lipoxygenase family protein [Paucibacter sp. APW11]|uniref:Lipoxygenase family protein n=1 Tax=Roseateles aquae TaxID=3077235 RepID=A0ABU3PAJ4_9BURK|nr:lipoxygenase family protein [Paucibacter sp. APW11]MDT8999240.1 lipoxygenase family protein [Paucibacter sp. APW11]